MFSEKSSKRELSPEMRVTIHLCPQESIRSALQGAAITKPSMAPSVWDPVSNEEPGHS